VGSALEGFVIGLTADRRSEEQISLLEGRGAKCLHGPTMRTHPLGSQDEIAAATQELISSPPTALVVQTGIGIRAWFEAAEAVGLAQPLREALEGRRIFCRGPKAVGAAITVGLEVDWVATALTARAVADHISAQIPAGSRIAVQNAGDPEAWLSHHLRDAGYEVIEVPVYQWTLPENPEAAEILIRAIVEKRTDAVTFTSKPAVDNLVTIAGDMGLAEELRSAFASSVVPACVGPVTAARASELGFGEVLHPERFRLGAMVQQLTDALAGREQSLQLAGHSLVLRGRQLDGLAAPVLLAPRERAVLVALIERPGVVLSKSQLLDTVWLSRVPGEHTVEVTVGRLRRRLGAAGRGVQTVARRGYRVSAD